MSQLKSWRALFVREFREHRISFLYVPTGIVVLLAMAAGAALSFNQRRLETDLPFLPGLKIYEMGYLILLGMWLAYLAVVSFFYFGDAFSADRRNNAMFFWKSLPVSDLKILVSKFLSGTILFAAIVLLIAAVTGLLFYLVVNLAGFTLPALIVPSPLNALWSFGEITGFAIVHVVLSLLWYAPFLAWVGALSTIFGRWSLPLAFVIPGLLAVAENIAFFGNGPRYGYVWASLSQRLQFGLTDSDWGAVVMTMLPFSAADQLRILFSRIDWLSMSVGLAVAALFILLASEYRRRRIN